MDRIEIIQRLVYVRNQISNSNGTLNRNTSALNKAIKIIKFQKNVWIALIIAYVCGISTTLIAALTFASIFR